jgi:hypothetical protein
MEDLVRKMVEEKCASSMCIKNGLEALNSERQVERGG